MPKSKSNAAATANEKAIAYATSNPHAIFARVEGCLGAYFRLTTPKGEVKGSPRGLFTFKTLRIERNDIVILEASATGVHEIIGRLSITDAARLHKAGKIPKEVYKPDVIDELFDRSEPELTAADIDAI